MADDGPIGERIAVYRRRRGLSQSALAGLVGRSESWLSQVERGIRSVDRLSVLIDIGRVLKVDVEVLAGQPFSLAPNGEPGLDGLEAIRGALTSYDTLLGRSEAGRDLATVGAGAKEVHRRYQAAEYATAGALLPDLIRDADAHVGLRSGETQQQALAVQGEVYVAAAKLLTKVGDSELAWISAERLAGAAMQSHSPAMAASAAYQLSCAFLKAGRLDDAEHVCLSAADDLARTSPDFPDLLSLQGALLLLAAIIAARRNERPEARRRLSQAEGVARIVGADANHAWTAFGPTNAQIHRVSVAAELGDAGQASRYGDDLDTSRLPPGLLSRRCQVHIDVAWANAQRRDDQAAVIHLLEAERVAAQALRYNVIVRELLREMLKRERRSATPGLRAVAQRAGVLSA